MRRREDEIGGCWRLDLLWAAPVRGSQGPWGPGRPRLAFSGRQPFTLPSSLLTCARRPRRPAHLETMHKKKATFGASRRCPHLVTQRRPLPKPAPEYNTVLAALFLVTARPTEAARVAALPRPPKQSEFVFAMTAVAKLRSANCTDAHSQGLVQLRMSCGAIAQIQTRPAPAAAHMPQRGHHRAAACLRERAQPRATAPPPTGADRVDPQPGRTRDPSALPHEPDGGIPTLLLRSSLGSTPAPP